MSGNSNSTKKLTLISLILMIFTSVFGFGNMPRSFYLMGYSAIPWYIISAITFFIPYAFMMAEFGAAFKDEKGGIYSWMEKSVGPKFAFMGTFMWYASYIVWMVTVSSTIWISFSTAIFGKDTTQSWGILGLNSTQTLGVLGVLLILLVTFTSTKGLEKITKVTSIGGTAVASLNIVLVISAIFLLITSGGNIAEPIVGVKSFTVSPNHNYLSTISILSFLVYAIFAYGGIEVVGGLVDQTENAEKTFPKGVALAAIIISIGYSIGIFLFGTFINWNEVLSGKNVNLGNLSIFIMNNLGYKVGLGIGLSKTASVTLGLWFARFFSIAGLLAMAGAFFTLSYAPLKQLIEGTPAKLWPKKMSELKNGMPVNAMIVQCSIVVVFILLVSFGGDAAAKFFEKLTLMTNVAMTLPYMFLAIAFISFKKKDSIHKPFEVYKNKTFANIAAILVVFTIGFANFFTIIEPATKGQLDSTLWSIGGPIFFSVLAMIMYKKYENRVKNENNSINVEEGTNKTDDIA